MIASVTKSVKKYLCPVMEKMDMFIEHILLLERENLGKMLIVKELLF